MKKSSLAVIFITLCYIFLILTSHNPLLARNVFGESPSFSSQEINTGIHNGIRVDGIKHTQTKADFKDSFDSSSDIQRVTYFSDGKTLNATIWLGGAVKQNPSLYGASTAVYGVLIDEDNNPLTGKYGVDYQKEIQWSGNTHSWSSLFVQYSSPTNFRTLDVEKNYSGFFQNNQKYVLLLLNLKSITSPDRFRVLYYAILIYNESKILLDLTPWIDIPPSQYTFSTTPDPVLITQGEQKDIGVQLRSSTGILPKLVDFKPFQNYSNVKVIFNPNKLDVSSIGFAPVPLRLEVPSNAQIGKYTIPILLNMSTGSIFPSKFIQLGNLSVSIPSQGYISTKGNLSISVIEPPSIDQRIKDFWSVYGSLISLVGAGFAGAASTFVFEYVKNHKGKNK